MDRSEKISEITQSFFNERSQSVYEQLCEEYQMGKNDILKGYRDCVRQAIEAAKIHQANKEKGEIEYFSISYLLSSAITGSFDFQVSLMDWQYFLDPVECCAYWSPDFLFTHLKDDLLGLRTTVDKELIRVRSYEIESALRGYVYNFYYGLAGMFFAEHSKAFAIDAGIEGLCLAKEVSFVFGGLMEQSTMFDSIKGEKSA